MMLSRVWSSSPGRFSILNCVEWKSGDGFCGKPCVTYKAKCVNKKKGI